MIERRYGTLQEGLDPRQQAFVNEGKFIEPYHDDLAELYKVLGEAMHADPERMANEAFRAWFAGEHGGGIGKRQYSPGQCQEAFEVLAGAGILNSIKVPDGIEIDCAAVLGGVESTNERRMSAVPAGVRRTILMTGQRLRSERDGTLEDNEQALLLLRTMAPTSSFAATELAKRTEATNPWEARLATETSLGRLTVAHQMVKGADPVRISLGAGCATRLTSFEQPILQYIDEHGDEAAIPPRLITDYHYQHGDNDEVVVMNAAAVERPMGPPRHTTESTMVELTQRFPLGEGSNFLFVTSAPHLRTAYGVKQQLKRLYPDGRAQFHVALAECPPDMGIHLPLGEIPAMIMTDLRHNRDANR